jgi:tetratricopeptide (TPR) repeat protein
MRSVLHSNDFASYAGRFVWLEINFDDTRNEDFLAKHVAAFPVLSIIDPESEAVTRMWSGTATREQLAAFLDGKSDEALRRGDALLGKGDADGAVKAYDEALAAGANREHVVEQLATAVAMGDPKACATRLAAELPKLPRAHTFIEVAIAGAVCAWQVPSVASGDDGKRLEALANEALALPVAGEDDHYQLFEALYMLRKTASDDAGAKAVAERYLAYVDQRPAPTSDDERMARDLARVRAAVKLGAPDRAIATLEASEKLLANDAGASARLATAYSAAGNLDGVIAATTRGLDRHPTPTEAARMLAMRATAHAKRGDGVSANADLVQAIESAKKIPVATMRDGTVAQLKKQLAAQ